MKHRVYYQLEVICKCANCGGFGISMFLTLPEYPIEQVDIDRITDDKLFSHGYMRATDTSFVCCESCLEEYDEKLQKVIENE